MDGLSGAASVIAVLQLATAVGSALKDYYEGVRDAREDIRKLYGSIKGLEGILERLKDVAKGMSAETLLTQPLEGVRAELKDLKEKLQGSEASETRARRALQSLVWPFKKKDAEKLVVAIEKHKSSLSLLVGVESLHLGFKQFEITADIRADINKAQSHEDRRRIVDWLSEGIPDPSLEHNIARDKHEETTGSWLIHDNNDYSGWLTAPNSFLWLNGGAGAGKSILWFVFPPISSTIIDDLQNRCRDEPSSAVVYWYFTFRDVKKQDVSNCIRSLIADICSNRRNTPQFLQNEYERVNVGRQKPTMKSYITMLRDVIAGFDNIYIVLDALDECPKIEERSRLLELLHDICDWDLSSLHVLVTSRRESDIAESFTNFTGELDNFTSIIAAGPQVEEDITKYLQQQLHSSLFRKWKKSLRRDVEIALASKADGMFRLVALQLEALSRLRAESMIRSAMENLPQTLDEFYDRIILEIPEEDQEYANRALQWIAFAARPLSLKELAEAVIISPENEPCLRDEDRLMNCNALLDIIPSGLIRAVYVEIEVDNTIIEFLDSSSKQEDTSEGYSKESSDGVHVGSVDGSVIESMNGNDTESVGGSGMESEDDSRSHGSFTSAGYADSASGKTKLIVQFAHFSVKEYLMSSRMLGNSTVSRFNLDELSIHEAVGLSCISYLTYVASQHPTITKRIFLEFPLLHFTANSWQYHLLKLEGHHWRPEVEKTALDFLKYGSPVWHIWATFVAVDAGGYEYYDLRDDVERLPSSRPHIFYKKETTHPITWLSITGLNFLLQKLLDQKPDLASIPQTRRLGSLLHAAVWARNKESVELLCAGGADVNQSGGSYKYALQVAAYNEDLDMVVLLLRHGADIEAQGGMWETALGAAAASGNIEIVQILLQEGADINAQGDYGTALVAAAANGNIEIVRLLLQEGADINAQGGTYGTALGAAAASGGIEIVRILLQEGADVYARGSFWGPALQQAVSRANDDVVEVLLDASVENRYQDIWDTMCNDLKGMIRRLESKDLYSRLERARRISKMLDQWLAKQESKKKVEMEVELEVEEESEHGVEDSEATALTVRGILSD
ncbi:putative ankyrin repeat protein [Lachnellula subtilissima]|uniref:Putative ankyrin repeat protein n=1 Tax=Lachnellula subtilissima TaxID=602034 RepID=A0A8H8S4F6_9HELO|nr:putative ankyrin repeat protein [Lachnellula subtilissima]